MNVVSLQLSEFATVGSGNRLTVVNIFDRMMGPGPHWGMPLVYLSWVILGHPDEAGQHDVEVKLLNAARDSVLPNSLQFPLDLGVDDRLPGMPLRNQGIYTIGGLLFQAPGPYAFEMYIDDVYAASTMLYVIKGERGPTG